MTREINRDGHFQLLRTVSADENCSSRNIISEYENVCQTGGSIEINQTTTSSQCVMEREIDNCAVAGCSLNELDSDCLATASSPNPELIRPRNKMKSESEVFSVSRPFAISVSMKNERSEHFFRKRKMKVKFLIKAEL